MCFNLKFELRAIIDNNDAIDFDFTGLVFFSLAWAHTVVLQHTLHDQLFGVAAPSACFQWNLIFIN